MESVLPEEIEVTIKSLDKKELKFKFNKKTTIKEVKTKISSDFSLDQDKMRLIYKARKLEDHMKLEDFCKKPKETFYIVAKFTGNNSTNQNQSNPPPNQESQNPTQNTTNQAPNAPPFQQMFGNLNSQNGGFGNLFNSVLGSLQNMQPQGGPQGGAQNNPNQPPPQINEIFNNINSMFGNLSANAQNGGTPNQGNPFGAIFTNLGNMNRRQATPTQPNQTQNTPAPPQNQTPQRPAPPQRPVSSQPPRPAQPENIRLVNSNQNVNHIEGIDQNGIHLRLSSGRTFNNSRFKRVNLPTQRLRNMTHIAETNTNITENYFRTRRNACTIASTYMRTLNNSLHKLTRELEWAAVAFENEARESNVGYRNMQGQRVRNIGEMMQEMNKILREMEWMKQFDFGEEPGKFFVRENSDENRENNLNRRPPADSNGGNNGNDDQGDDNQRPPVSRENQASNQNEDFQIDNEPQSNSGNGQNRGNQENVGDIAPPVQVEEPMPEIPAEETEENLMVNKYKELLKKGIPIDTSLGDMSKIIKKEIKKDNQSSSENPENVEDSDENDFLSLLLSEITHGDIFKLINGDITCFDQSWPKIKKKYQDFILENSNEQDIICEQLLSSLNTKMVEALSDVFKPEFDPHGIYLEIDSEYFPKFNSLFLGEYKKLIRNQNNEFMQNVMGSLQGGGMGLPPQIQNMLGGVLGGQNQANQTPSYENDHLPLFSEEIDNLLIDYWGKLVYKYSKGVELSLIHI